MSADDFHARATRIFGSGSADVLWPYDVSGIDRTLRLRDPERYQQELDVLTGKREVIVAWAEHYGLRTGTGCCPRWLLKNASHRCWPYTWRPSPPSSSKSCTWGTDERWLDHPIWWVRDRRPVAVTGAPYHFDDTSRARVDHWLGLDARLAFACGTGWYGYGTVQTILWRTDRIKVIAPAEPATEGAR